MKIRTCFLALLFLLLALNAAAAETESFALNMEGYDALVAREGEVLIAPDTYHEIYPIGGGYFALGIENVRETGFKDTYFALADSEGKPLTEAEYTHLEYADGRIVFEKNDLYGVMDAACEVIVPCEYTWLCGNAEGYLAFVSDPWDTTGDVVYALSADGMQVQTEAIVLDVGEAFSEGLLPALSAETGSYGYLNIKGEWQIQPSFSYAGRFDGGAARASKDGKLGLIDAAGEWILEPKFDVLENGGEIWVGTVYSRGVSILLRETLQEVVLFSGKEVYAQGFADFAAVYMPGKVLLTDAQGKILFEESEDIRVAHVSDVVVIQREDEMFLSARNGEKLSDAYAGIFFAGRYGEKDWFIAAESVGSASSNVQYGLIDSTGSVILPCEYDVLYALGEDRFFAQQGNKSGMTDALGAWICCFEGDS